MSWLITPQTKVPVDPYRSQVSLLLHGDGANGSTTITDSSPTPKTVTAVGNAQISTAQSKFGGASIAFDGTGDGLNIIKTAAFDFGTQDFTVEAWVYFSSGSFKIIDTFEGYPGNSYAFTINSSRYLLAEDATAGYSSQVATSQQLSINTWHHVAFSKASGTLRLFANGLQATTTGSIGSSVNTAAARINIGYTESFGGGSYLNGYIDELRITKGVARYTSNFTPPTAPFPDI